MVQPTRPPINRFNAFARRIYNPLGFSKAYNFILFFIFNGALLGFTLARLQYLDFNGIFCSPTPSGGNGAAPGECYYYLRDRYKVGIIMHLAGILPAAFLATLQFVPAIRHAVILFHRINGYVVILLVLVANAGALMIARHAFGGGLDTQAVIGALAIVTTGSLVLALVNIKRLQIEQHRAWMLRTWFYVRALSLFHPYLSFPLTFDNVQLGSIITTRIIQITTATVVSAGRNYFVARPCAQLLFTLAGSERRLLAAFPECAAYVSGGDAGRYALVRADMGAGGPAGPAGVGAALGVGFGMALWLALVVHAVGVEVYLKLTPREHERLRNVSYQRQLEAGMKNPGSAGLTVERLGDAEPWVPKCVAEKQEEKERQLSSGTVSVEQDGEVVKVEDGAPREN
ncbi:hypothetical protein SLS58_002157 [Diplodia intermedia]|uniref:Microtubule associated protein n=1 Tax=Diplodia intermedia TaxID=856260 RepID=A0ABR3TZX6_9PEZI